MIENFRFNQHITLHDLFHANLTQIFMKQFQLLLSTFLLTFSFGFIGHLQAQCTPDQTATSVGFYPDTFASGLTGLPYDFTMSAVLPKDTTVDLPFVGQTTFSFCSFEIDTVFLPDGLTYDCDAMDCVWNIDHSAGIINRGCIRVQGTPLSPTVDDSITVVIRITPGYIDSMRNNICNTDSLRDDLGVLWGTVSALLVQQARFKMVISPQSSIIPDLASFVHLQVSPNPVVGESQISYTLPEAEEVTISIYNSVGTQIKTLQSEVVSGNQQVALNSQNLAPGLYFVRMQVGTRGQAVRKFVVK